MTFMIFATLTAKYLRIRQTAALAALKGLNERLQREANFSTSTSQQRMMVVFYCKYFALNRHQVALCKQIEAYSRFWAPYLSFAFPYYILNICYLAFLALLDESVPFHNRYIYAMITAQMAPFFVLLIRQCAAVVQLNGAVLGQNRRSFLLLSRGFLGAKQRQVNNANRTLGGGSGNRSAATFLLLLKAEQFQKARRFYAYAFKLLPMRARISSKMFHTVRRS